MKKISITIIAVILLLIIGYFGYNYYNGPKIVDGVVSKNIDAKKGNPVDITTEFSPEDTVYFSAKGNRFWVKKADVVWYKGKIATENRFLVEENVEINNDGYFSVKLSVPEDLEEGHYGVTIYSGGKRIVETRVEFDVKK
ncbi:hypothetical protein J2Z76_001068 [Sedimentibacter acidaminivorans]|uniref:Uncharacterized protein n=1 Tax=Sedimentibacter acidaminivorans TaxID=913099 RepID=A0ABS4GBY9_9FIRM|nr:hypothetical protein [Sedimentibacter acidaminivorans]MBP1925211.1 hypothetical protein [Sedimentibacter acidaminivorans]